MERSMVGWGSGLVGVVIFSGSLPATRLAVHDFSPMFLTSARAVIAALLGGVLYVSCRQQLPGRSDIFPLAIVALGVVVGFPLLTALALERITAAHSIVFIGLLPLSTAVFGVVRGGERPKPAFWLFSSIGAATVVIFALSRSDGGSLAGDLLMIAAVLVCGLGYAEGATLARRIGGWQVISLALLLSLPVMALVALFTLPGSAAGFKISAWMGLAYVSIFSMLVGFIFWYRGLALGGIAKIGQLQLLQPFMGLVLAAVFLHEQVVWTMFLSALIVVLSVFGAKRFAG
jgi:drug/metabolite transporter (DMT)-like permease